jgi:hypothetical protein
LSYLKAWEIRPGIHRCSNESSRLDRKKGVLVNTPTLTWAYTWTFKERERRDESPGIGSFSNQKAVYLNNKR